jgi:hypothetical protein
MLQYCLSDLQGESFSQLSGLQLIPTAANHFVRFEQRQEKTKSYKAERARGLMYTCNTLEYELLSAQPQWLVDNTIPEGLYTQLCSQPLQENTNVRTLNPRTFARLFDTGTLPLEWKRCTEVAWSGEAEQPTREWVALFWKYLDECRVDLACFEDWPLLPCVGGLMRRMISESSVVDMEAASEELRECLLALGCRALDATVVAKQPQGLENYVNRCTADGIVAAICCCAAELQANLERTAVSAEVISLLDMLRAIGVEVSAKLADKALVLQGGDPQSALNWILEHDQLATGVSSDGPTDSPFVKLFAQCNRDGVGHLRAYLATELRYLHFHQ